MIDCVNFKDVLDVRRRVEVQCDHFCTAGSALRKICCRFFTNWQSFTTIYELPEEVVLLLAASCATDHRDTKTDSGTETEDTYR